MNFNETVKVHEVYGPDVYDRSYGDGQHVKTVVILNIAGDEKEVYNATIPENTMILKILQDIDINADSGETILTIDKSNRYSLKYGYDFTDKKIKLNTQIEDIVTRGKHAIRQAIIKIEYNPGVGIGCNIMGGRKYYKKYKKTYNKSKKSKKSKKSRKSRRHRRK
jgi:hypothetical protein